VHSAVGNVISCIGLIAIVAYRVLPGHGRIVIRRSRIVWTKGAATAPFSMVRLMLHIQAVVPGLGAPKWPTTLDVACRPWCSRTSEGPILSGRKDCNGQHLRRFLRGPGVIIESY
jgi:hypothetical protein